MAQDQYTGTGAIAQSWEPKIKCRLTEVELHLSATGGAAENFTATKDDHSGSVYDVVYISEAMAAVADLVSLNKHELAPGDKVVFAYTNTNSRTWGLTVKYELINEYNT